jgi:outer membrane murein-binding lipoprotein Lpp
MKTKRLLAAVIVVSVLAAGCSSHQSKGQPPAGGDTGTKNAGIEALDARIKALESDVLRLQLQVARHDSVSLDPAQKGYERIDTDSGFFLVSVTGVEPYLDGYRVHLRIGNPAAARYHGFTLTFTWQEPMPVRKAGESDEEYHKRDREWLKAESHEKTVSFTETLYPSSWNTVSAVVSPATAKELRGLAISSMETDQIALATR